ncbi:hypothetical protein CUU66_03500 [Peribacillus deserti]|uniref:Uncharacterized protein n=2 Tax=Peribacillus deserti TaxID=673318 RepID=A0A2N5MA68_9BACI|nr:hypothetical protein CUU66_03500 [Peribacillus deserti]
MAVQSGEYLIIPGNLARSCLKMKNPLLNQARGSKDEGKNHPGYTDYDNKVSGVFNECSDDISVLCSQRITPFV